MGIKMKFLVIFAVALIYVQSVAAYDPDDKEIESIIPKPGEFEAFYPRETQGISNSAARAPHAHGSYFKHRNPGEKESAKFNVKFFSRFCWIFDFCNEREKLLAIKPNT
jgi:hypothetical protein